MTVKGRILLSKIWKMRLSWDQKILLDLQLIWDKLYQDLVSLDCLRFRRFVVDSSTSASLLVFCDASQRSYIFQCGSASLVFSKAKVAPLITRTLPSLELFCFPHCKMYSQHLKSFSTRNCEKYYCGCRHTSCFVADFV